MSSPRSDAARARVRLIDTGRCGERVDLLSVLRLLAREFMLFGDPGC